MNILIQFEDSYGCKSLFQKSKSILNKDNIEIIGSLGNIDVFNVSKRMLRSYDYILIVFDMDSADNCSLTSKELIKNMTNKHYFDSTGKLKENYANKVILIPVFFCYESLLFYYKWVQNYIDNLNKNMMDETTKLIMMYKTYYDYSSISPEDLEGIVHKLNDMQKKTYVITKSQKQQKWYPQTFHKSYCKQTLKHIFKSLRLSDKIFDKKEDQLFTIIENNRNIGFKIDDWINDIIKYSNLNQYYAKLLSLSNINNLANMTIQDNLEKIQKILNDYNIHIHGLQKRNVYMCISNIETYIQIGYNLERAKSKCINQDKFSKEEVEQAIRLMYI